MNKETPIDINRLVRKDKAAWDEFVERFSAVIYGTVQRVLIDHTGKAETWDSSEAAQEVFVRLIKDRYRLLRTYDPKKASLATWLTIISRSTAIDFLRRRKFETVPLPDPDKDRDASYSHDPSYFTVEIPTDLLTVRQKLILHLLFDRDMDPSEVASLLGVEVQTVRSSKHKAFSRLRKLMGLEGNA